MIRRFIVRGMMVFALAVVAFGYVAAEEPTIDFMAAGDIEWSGVDVRTFFLQNFVLMDNGGRTVGQGGWQPVPKLMSYERFERLKAGNSPEYQLMEAGLKHGFGENVTAEMLAYHFKATPLDIEFDSPDDRALYPFRRIAGLLADADVTFANLESPLSDYAEMSGLFKTPTNFVNGLAFAGIDVVSIANNHMLDASRQGLRDTVATLDGAGILHAGGGRDLETARQPAIIERNGIKIGILAYTQSENNGDSSFASPTRPGVMPLDPELIREDIARLKEKADFVALSFHWGIYYLEPGKGQQLHPAAVEFAHNMVDSGADIVLGHHPHFPRAIEIYKGKPVFYSLSHLIFSFTQPDWMDNFVARLTLSKEKVQEIMLYPVAGKGEDLQQPYVLEGQRAEDLLSNLAGLSKEFGTEILIEDSVGTITLP